MKECAYCAQSIPDRASKCHHCLEWQEMVPADPAPAPAGDQEPGSVSLRPCFQERLLAFSRLPYPISVLIVCSACFLCLQVSWLVLDEERIYLLTLGAFSLQMAISWAGVIWIHRKMAELSGVLQHLCASSLWRERPLAERLQELFSTPRALLFGLATGLAASVGDYLLGTPFQSPAAKGLFAGFEFIYMFLAGAAVYTLLAFGRLVFVLSDRLNTRIEGLERSSLAQQLGRFHLQTALLAILPLVLGVAAKLVRNWEWSAPVVLWYVAFAVLIVVYIYLPMLRLHEVLLDEQGKQVTQIEQMILESSSEAAHAPTTTRLLRISELKKLRDAVSLESTWPFNPKAVSASFIAIGLPILLLLVDKFWPKG